MKKKNSPVWKPYMSTVPEKSMVKSEFKSPSSVVIWV